MRGVGPSSVAFSVPQPDIASPRDCTWPKIAFSCDSDVMGHAVEAGLPISRSSQDIGKSDSLLPSGQPIKKTSHPSSPSAASSAGARSSGQLMNESKSKGSSIEKSMSIFACERPFGLQVKRGCVGDCPTLDEAENADGRLVANERY